MKNIWQRHKKLIMGTTAVVLAVGIIAGQVLTGHTEAEAGNILNSMKVKYGNRTEFRVLEVVPEHNTVNFEEMGIFLQGMERADDPADAAKSRYFKQTFRQDLANNTKLDRLLEMRLYGVVKYSGTDSGARINAGNNPIYNLNNGAETPAFVEGQSIGADYTMVPSQYLFTTGFYTYQENANYKLADGYYIAEDGCIYKTENANADSEQTTAHPSFESDDEEEEDGIDETEDDEDDSVSENTFRLMVEVEDGEMESMDEGMETTTEEVTVTDELESDEPIQLGEDGPEEEVENSRPLVDYQPTSLSGNTVSGNAVKIEPDLSAKYYRFGYDGNTMYCPLPEGVTYVGDGSGNITFTPSENGYYWGYSITKTGYMKDNNYYYNKNWLKDLLFGNRNASINVVIDTVPAGSVTKENIEKADLVYISGTAEAFASNGQDITAEVLQEIYNSSVVNHKAVLMDYDVYSGAATSNLDKLAILIWQADHEAVVDYYDTKFEADETDENYKSITDVASVLGDTTLLADLSTTMLTGVEGNFVTGNVYVYDHHMDLFDNSVAMVDANDFFANGDLNSLYKSTVYNVAFSSVYAHISNNNVSYVDSKVADGVTPALALQYILSAEGVAASIVKSSVHVLEIQPCPDFLYNETNVESTEYGYASEEIKENRDEFIEKFVNPDFVTNNKQGYVSFTSMTINEFVCKNENVADLYDMVYIGSQSGDNGHYYHKKTEYSWDTKNNEKTDATITVFNDSLMDGMVYFNIGDKTEGTEETTAGGRQILTHAGFLDDEPQTAAAANNNTKIHMRYSGRDLNTDKLKELQSYLDAGHPIVVASDLMCTDSSGVKVLNPTQYANAPINHTADHGRVDNSSKLYELFQYALLKEYNEETGEWVSRGGTDEEDETVLASYNNFISEADVEDGLVTVSDISNYLNAPQLYIDISSKPEEYEYVLNGNVIDPNSITYLQPDEEDGAYYLDYEFTISGVSSTDMDYVYTARLLVDVNADGKFSTDEECDDAVITYAATGEEVETIDNPDGESVYALTEGTSYKLRRALPEDYSGVITWCLRAEIASDNRFKASETGYTCVKADKKAEIRILQVTNDDKKYYSWAFSTLNLEQQMQNKNSMFGKYLTQLADYDVHVKTLTVSEFEAAYMRYITDNEVKDPMEFFDNYQVYTQGDNADVGKGVNMLILGFGDDYVPFAQEEPIAAVKAFMDSGRAVLLCHDFLMFQSDNLQVEYLRNIVGMDRYNVTGNIPSLHSKTGDKMYTRKDDKAQVKAAESAANGRLVAYQPGSDRNRLLRATQGFADTHMRRYTNHTNQQTYANTTAVKNFSNYQIEAYIDQMNEGQITDYPYKIPNTFKVAKTHAQYYQLDLESDSDNDGSADTVVWYTLAHNGDRTNYNSSLYSATAGDGANQYYIYNKGNITYTGAGHDGSYTESEAQLFVNTMLASYTAVDKAPVVKFFETSSATSNELDNMAIPYDSTITNATLNQNAEDSSIQYNEDKDDYDYKFVDPNVDETVAPEDRTAVYFKATDANFKKGTKRMSLTFYLEIDPLEYAGLETNALGQKVFPITQTTNSVVKNMTIEGESVYVAEIPIQVYTSDFSEKVISKEIVNEAGITTQTTAVESGQMYGMYLPLSYLRNHGAISIYLEAQTYIHNVSTSGVVTAEVNEALGYGKLDITKVDLLKLD